MTPEDASGNGGRPLAVEVAIIGAGPVGLMTANLLGLAGIRVLVLERNAGLLGLPRAIAYDAETLRLFSQVGLFDEIAPGLIQDPHVRHLNARNVTLMAADFPRGLYGHSSLGTFYQPDFERVLLKGLARFPSVRVAFEHEATDLVQNAKGVTLSVATPSGATTVEADYVVACDGGDEPHAGAPRRQAGRLDLFRALAGGRRDRQESRRQPDHLHLRSAPAPGRAAGGRRAGAVGVHAAARRKRGDAEARRDDPRPRRRGGRRPRRSRSSARRSIRSMRASPNIGGAAASSSPATRRI